MAAHHKYKYKSRGNGEEKMYNYKTWVRKNAQCTLQPTRCTINNEQITAEEDLINVMIDE